MRRLSIDKHLNYWLGTATSHGVHPKWSTPSFRTVDVHPEHSPGPDALLWYEPKRESEYLLFTVIFDKLEADLCLARPAQPVNHISLLLSSCIYCAG